MRTRLYTCACTGHASGREQLPTGPHQQRKLSNHHATPLYCFFPLDHRCSMQIYHTTPYTSMHLPTRMPCRPCGHIAALQQGATWLVTVTRRLGKDMRDGAVHSPAKRFCGFCCCPLRCLHRCPLLRQSSLPRHLNLLWRLTLAPLFGHLHAAAAACPERRLLQAASSSKPTAV
jgi:hypothetical protein